MKKTAILFGLLFVAAVVMSSCRTQKQACAAYSQVEKPKADHIPG